MNSETPPSSEPRLSTLDSAWLSSIGTTLGQGVVDFDRLVGNELAENLDRAWSTIVLQAIRRAINLGALTPEDYKRLVSISKFRARLSGKKLTCLELVCLEILATADLLSRAKSTGTLAMVLNVIEHTPGNESDRNLVELIVANVLLPAFVATTASDGEPSEQGVHLDDLIYELQGELSGL